MAVATPTLAGIVLAGANAVLLTVLTGAWPRNYWRFRTGLVAAMTYVTAK